MSFPTNKLTNYLLRGQGFNKTLVKWLYETGYDNIPAFTQTFALPNLDLVGISHDLYLPDKSFLGKRTELILAFEQTIATTAKQEDLTEYFIKDRKDFQLRSGHIIGLQLMATELRSKGGEFSETRSSETHEQRQREAPRSDKKQSKNDSTQELEPELPFDPEEGRKQIMEKLTRKMANDKIECNDIVIEFRNERAYMKCPFCRQSCLIVQRKRTIARQIGIRYEVYETYKHFYNCYQNSGGKVVKRARRERRRYDHSDDSSSMEYVNVKVEDILGKNALEHEIYNDDSE